MRKWGYVPWNVRVDGQIAYAHSRNAGHGTALGARHLLNGIVDTPTEKQWSVSLIISCIAWLTLPAVPRVQHKERVCTVDLPNTID